MLMTTYSAPVVHNNLHAQLRSGMHCGATHNRLSAKCRRCSWFPVARCPVSSLSRELNVQCLRVALCILITPTSIDRGFFMTLIYTIQICSVPHAGDLPMSGLLHAIACRRQPTSLLSCASLVHHVVVSRRCMLPTRHIFQQSCILNLHTLRLSTRTSNCVSE